MLSKEMSYHISGENPAALGRVLVAVLMVRFVFKLVIQNECIIANEQLSLSEQLHLAREDVIAAGKVIQEWGGNAQHEEVLVAFVLMDFG